MTGILLSAGFGTRLHPITKNKPKALLQVEGKPILDYLMDQVMEWDQTKEVHLVSNARMMSQFYSWSRSWKDQLGEKGCAFTISSNGTLKPEDSPGSVADLHRALQRVDVSDGVWVAATDSIYRFNLQPMLERYISSGVSQVMALQQPNAQRLRDQSVLDLDGNRVLAVVDHPDEPPSKWVCPSFYVLSPRAIEVLDSYVQDGRESDSLGVFVNTLAENEPVRAWRKPETDVSEDFKASGLRFHINTKYQLDKAQEILAAEPLVKRP